MTVEPPTLLYLVKQVELAVRARLEDLVRPAGLTALQYTALTVLERHPDLTAAQLARRSFVSAQSTADLVAGLQSRHLIERHRDPGDRRRLVLALTDAGRDVLAQLRQPVADLEERMVADLSPAAVARLRGSLEACRAAVSLPPC